LSNPVNPDWSANRNSRFGVGFIEATSNPNGFVVPGSLVLVWPKATPGKDGPRISQRPHNSGKRFHPNSPPRLCMLGLTAITITVGESFSDVYLIDRRKKCEAPTISRIA
jgi:hypothetical protein